MVVVDQLSEKGGASWTRVRPDGGLHPSSIGTVGLTEPRPAKGTARCHLPERIRSLKHTLSGSTERTLMKLVVDDVERSRGGPAHGGAEAGEIVQGFAVALKAGATKAVFDATSASIPTAAEDS